MSFRAFNPNGLRSLFVILFLFVLINFCYAQRPSHDGKILLFGNLHAHSQLSADVESSDDEMLPAKAFKYAHEMDWISLPFPIITRPTIHPVQHLGSRQPMARNYLMRPCPTTLNTWISLSQSRQSNGQHQHR
jgi:hypothetical protein